MHRFPVVALLLLMVVLPGRAFAHASLVTSDPVDGAVLAEPPARVVLTFNEPVAPLSLRLIGPDQTEREPAVEATGATVFVILPPELARGTHALSYRVASEDGHPVGGTLLFSIGAPSGAPEAAGDAHGVPAVLFGLRLVLLAGLVAGVGGVFALAVFGGPDPAARRVLAVITVVGFCAVPPLLAVQGLDALGFGLDRIGSLEAIRAGLATRFARTLGIAALSFGLAVAALRSAGRWRTGLAAGALALVGLALAASGHAATAAPRWLTGPAVVVHGVAAAVWIGALLPLALGLGRLGGADGALARFSRAIPPVLMALVATGVLLAVVQVERPDALLDSPYGQVLLAKLALVALLLGVAAVNRWHHTQPALCGEAGAIRGLRRLIGLELVLAATILAVIGLWRFTPPPRALAVTAAAPQSLHLHGPLAMADITVAPGRAGPVTVTFSLLDGDFGPLVPQAVTAAFSHPERGLEPIVRVATATADGYRIDGLSLPVPGRWTVRLEILVTDFDLAVLEGTFALAP